MSKILVTGGCGYIGSHTIVDLLEKGYEVVSVDSHINSDQKPLEGIEKITGKTVSHYPIDLCDLKATEHIFEDHKDISGVIHFAALKAVGESVAEPVRYFRNNLNSIINILDCCQKYNVESFIFSSSCTVYGNAEELPVTEMTPEKPAESPYGRTKQIGEKIIQDTLQHGNTKAISLRYFNPAGAHNSALLGESPINAAQNLVPVITETAIGKRKSMVVYGDDYDTRDGTCVRDYIHVMDLADAHTKAMQFLSKNEKAKAYDVYNLGIGDGATVKEVIHAFESETNVKLNYTMGPRRPGDVVAIYANLNKAQQELNWHPQYNIKDIMKTAWKWEKVRSK